MIDFQVEIQKIISGDVDTSPATLDTYSTDWSLFSVRPQVVVFPKTASDIEQLVQWVATHKHDYPELSLTVRAAGTGMSGGSLNTSIIVDVNRYMQGVIDIDVDDFGMQTSQAGYDFDIVGHARVLPGTFYRDFEKQTHDLELELPCYPASKSICAVGGMVANNGAGEKSLKYGQNKDFVHKLKAVLSDGNEYTIKPLTYSELQDKRVERGFEGTLYDSIYALIKDNEDMINRARPTTSKNAAGYLLWEVLQSPSIAQFEMGMGYFDLTKLFVGAQGTTGIITEIEYKLIHVESESDLLVVFVNDLADVPALVSELMKSDLEMLEVYDDNTFKLGVKFFRQFIRDKGFWGALKYGVRFIPDMWKVITGGVPKLVVLAEFVSSDIDGLYTEVIEADERVKALGLKTLQALKKKQEEKYWDFRHDSFKLLTEHTMATRSSGQGTRTAPFIDDIAVNPEHFPEFLPRLVSILDKYELTKTIAGHLGNGNLHIIPLMDMNISENKAKILDASAEVYNLVLEFGGTITAEHNDGIIRTPYLAQMYGNEVVALFQKVKDIFDPKNIFNPGKKVGGTFDDIKKYLA